VVSRGCAGMCLFPPAQTSGLSGGRWTFVVRFSPSAVCAQRRAGFRPD
jgi:hypothetical protein